MKKTIYAAVSLKQLAGTFAAAVTAAALVFMFDAFYQKTNVSSEVRQNLPLIIIDAGHGGEDGGASSASGIVEKNINLSISQKLDRLLRSFGFDTLMVRTEDKLIYDSSCRTMREKKVSDIHNRMKILDSHPNGIFVSIHQNHFEQSKYSGAQVFFSKGNAESEIIADCLQGSVRELLQPDNTRQIKPSGTEIYLLYHAKSPAIMVECGFLSNSGEAQLLNDDEYQTKIAVAIADGLSKYLSK